MDPLSASASVAAVLQLTASVLKYLNCVKGAASERQRLLSELCSISSILYILQDQAENEAQDDTVHRMFVLLQSSNGPLEQFKSTLERLESKLAPTKGSGTVVGSIIWPFKRDEMKGLFEAIERQKTSITLARQNNLMYCPVAVASLSSKTMRLTYTCRALFKSINGNVHEVRNETVGLRERFRQLEDNTEYQRFVTWLNAPDPWINQNKASKLRHKHTGNWFIEGTVYREWLLTAPSTLWLHGIPGCGKTILASTIVQNLFRYQKIDPRAAVIFYYFDFNDAAKQTYENLIRSLVKQLVSQLGLVSGRAHLPYSSWQVQYQQQSENQLMSMLHQSLKQFERVYLVVDALDESMEREDLLRIIMQWTSWDDTQLHTILGSRKERDIEEVLYCLCDDRGIVGIQSALVDNDIRDYVQARLRHDVKLKRWRNKPRVQQLIVDSLMEKANGMFATILWFRWAACQLDVLGDCLTEAKLRRALYALPPTLDETYARILSNIKEEYQDYAFLMLQWLCFSPRPLLLEELAEVVAISNEEPWIHPEERLADSEDVLTICSTLITTEDGSREDDNFDPAIFYCQCRDRINHTSTFPDCDCFWPYSDTWGFQGDYFDTRDVLPKYARLAHFSVKEYLTSSRIPADAGFSFKICELDAQSRLYTSCLAYLLHINKIDRSRRDLWSEYPLIFHATNQWHKYAQSVERVQNHVPPLAHKFLLNEDNSFVTWLAMSHELGPPLYHASQYGLWRSVQILLDHGVDVNASGGYDDTALNTAAQNGHEQVVQLLISNGANVNAMHGYPPLYEAVCSGHRRVVRQLLESGADANSLSDESDTNRISTLQIATFKGDEHILQMLLDHGVNADPAVAQLRDQYIRDALTDAVERADSPLVRLLLDQIDSREIIVDKMGRTPLSFAAQHGNRAVLSMLMTRNNQYIEIADNTGRTPLSYAAEFGDAAALQMLLKHSHQHIDLADALGRTPLSYAAGRGPEGHETVALLLGHDKVNANSRDHEGRTPLLHAVGAEIQDRESLGVSRRRPRREQSPGKWSKRHQLLVTMFLDRDNTAVHTQDRNGRTSLWWAAQAGHSHLVELLLTYVHRGLDQSGDNGDTLIEGILRGGSGHILRLLSEHEVINLKELSNDDLAWNRISEAASRGDRDLLELLLNNSHLDPRSQDDKGRTLISLAAEAGNTKTLEFLLSVDSSTVDLPDKAGRTPFSYVSSAHYVYQVADLLLDSYCVSPDLPDEKYRAPISYAAQGASQWLVRDLLNRHVDVDRPDDQGRTPLSYALGESGNEEAAKMIIKSSTTGKDYADHTGRTPLSYAAEAGRSGALRYMLKKGLVEVNTPDKRGLTPLAYAEMRGDELDLDDKSSNMNILRERAAVILRNHGAYRLDDEKPASEEPDSSTESGENAVPYTLKHSALTTPLVESLSLAE